MDTLQPGLSAPFPTAAQALTPPASGTDKPTPDKGSGLDSLLSGIGAGGREAAKKVDALEIERMKLNPPKMELPPKPEPKQTDPIEAWGSIAMVFAGLASFKVRSHATTAMNAAAAGLNAIKQKDADAYAKAFKEWEISTKNTIEMAHFQQDAYKTLMESVEHRETLALEEGRMFDAATEAKFKALTTVLGDQAGAWEAYRQGGVKGLADFQALRQRQTESFELEKIRLQHQGKNAMDDQLAFQISQTPEFKAETTLAGKLRRMVDGGVSPVKIMEYLKTDETKNQTVASNNETRKDIAAAGNDTKKEIAAGKLDLGKGQLELNKQKEAFSESDKDRAFGFKTGPEFDWKKATAKEKMDFLQQQELDRVNKAKADLDFRLKKLDSDEDIKRDQIEERAREAFDKIALGKDTLAERAVNDKAKDEVSRYRLGETHEEFEQRQALAKEKLKIEQSKDAERKAEFREKMDLELKKFDEKKEMDGTRAKLAQDRLANSEKSTEKRAPPLSPDEIEQNAQLMAHLKMPMASDTLAARNPSWEAANLRAVEIAKSEGKTGFSEQWYPALLAQRKDAGSGQAAKGIRYLTVANKHLQSMESAIMALPNDADLKAVSRIFNFAANQVNDSNLAGEKVDGQIVANEVAKAISGAGNLSMDERKELNDMFDPNRGKQSLLEIIHRMRELLGGQVAGYMHQFSHYGDSADITGIEPETAKSFFVDPKTGETSEELVRKDRERARALLSGQSAPGAAPAAPAAGGAPGFKPTRQMNGKPIGVVNGKWVYEDGTPVQ